MVPIINTNGPTPRQGPKHFQGTVNEEQTGPFQDALFFFLAQC